MGTGQAANDLTFVSTDELIRELENRHDALVVTGVRFTTLNRYVVTRRHHGNRYVCLGQLSNMQAVINEHENSLLCKSKGD